MKKFNLLLVTGIAFLVSCTDAKQNLPKDPKDKQEYRDSSGVWRYNAAHNHWMFLPYRGSSSPYYYYPGSNNWTNSSGVAVTPPTSVPQTVRSTSVKPNSSSSSVSKPSSSSSVSKPSSSTSVSKPFGSTVKSSSIGG